jgi:hypothetical protein
VKTVEIFGAPVPAWIVVVIGALFVGVLYTESPQVGTPLLWAIGLLIVFSLVQQGKVRT